MPRVAAWPADGASDPKAAALLGEVIRAYKGLHAYSDQGKFVLALSVDGRSTTQELPLRLALVRPDRINLETGLSRLASDGKTLTTVINPLKRYTSVPAPRSITFETVFTGGSAGSAVFGGPSAPMMTVLANLLVGDDPAKALRDLGTTFTLGKDREIDGKSCRVLKISGENSPTILLEIDPDTKLLRAIDVEIDPKVLADSFPGGQKVRIDTFRWTAGTTSTKAVGDTAFRFEPPNDFTKAESLVAAGKPGDDAGGKFKVNELVGKPAPDFTLTILDGKGKIRTVSKAELAGKVVLLDFWATWCGPCLEELPEIQKLIETYSKDGKDVLVAAVSQDSDPKDPLEVRKLVESTLEKHKITLAGDPVGKVAIDPSNAVGEAFQVEGYPTLVLVDAKGIVQSAHVGFSPDVGKVLAGEIDALLGGKPLGQK
jgi:thiol-disulfide isomerase/thioredoxin